MFISGASLALLALAVSLDGFGVGASYGIRGIRIPVLSAAIIAACSGAVVWLAMTAGSWLTDRISAGYARAAGALLLIAVGTWALMQLRRNAKDGNSSGPSAALVMPEDPPAQTRRLGFVLDLLNTPQAADRDRSGVISASEAVLLGIALSLDALGAGFGAAMVGFPALPAALLIAAASGGFLLAGLRFGLRFASRLAGVRAISVLPGLILIATGVARLMEM